MTDQAELLRQLATSAEPALDAAQGGPTLVVVTGGKPGVGATTVALNVSTVDTHPGATLAGCSYSVAIR